ITHFSPLSLHDALPISGFIYSLYYNISQAGIGVGPVMRWFYNAFRWAWRGSLFPRKPGLIPRGLPTPSAKLNLQPGELVRVKSRSEEHTSELQSPDHLV